jgi:hypothetical protein
MSKRNRGVHKRVVVGVKFDTEEEKISEKKKKSICTDEMIKKKPNGFPG